MNNLKKTAVFGLIAVFAFSMLMVPFTPMTQVAPQVTTPLVSTPEEVKMDLKKYLDDRSIDGPLDDILTAYKETGMVPNNVVTNVDGAMGALITVTPETDLAEIEDIVDVNWRVDFGVATIMSAYIGSVDAVTALENHEGVVTAFADSLFRDTIHKGVEPRDEIVENPIVPVTQQYATTVAIGSDQVVLDGIDGTGVRVGVVDTGTDFSNPDMVDAIDFGSDGLPTSYDPSGWGFGMTLYRVNLTTVDPDAWMAASSWNVLSYTEDGKTYLDTGTYQHNGGSPYVQYFGGLYDLDFFYDAYLAAWWGDTYPNEANMTDFYYNTLRQPLQLPDPATISGGGEMNVTLNATEGTWQMVPYACNGYMLERVYDPSMRIFIPALVVNSTKLVVDWNTTRAWTHFWNLNINYGVYDFNETSTLDMYDAMGDWSFADDLAEDLYYTADGTPAHTNLVYDYPDGERLGLGVLGHVWEPGIFGLGMVDGFGLGGRVIGIVYDGDSHGTFVASQIASRGLTQYPVGINGTMQYLPGVAPDSTIMGVKTIGVVSEFHSMLYTAGFDYNGGTGYWEWNYDSDHAMDISSNSWGWVTPQYYELWGQYSLLYACVATPGFFNATHYPGMIICFSAGNSGPGSGTTTPPRAPQLIGVGATTSYHTFENAYGPDQGFDQVADFSSRGPLTYGYPKPDILAPGRNNFGLVPTYGDLFGIGTPGETANYAGTSMACPMVAGVAALLIDAYRTNNGNANMTPDYYKTLMMSTADDVGADAMAQGSGLVNAWTAYEYIASGTGNRFYTYDSIENWATATQAAWSARMNPYDIENFVNTTTPPTGFADTSLFFGLVEAGSYVEMDIMIDGAQGDFSDWSWTAMEYVEDTTTTFTFDTYIYNETTSTGYDETKGGWFNFTTELGGNYANFAASTYATVMISGDQATFEDDSLWAFIFDWEDTVANGQPDYYNETNGLGDELTRWQYGGGTGNVLKMDLSHPLGLSNLFPNEGIVMVYDDNLDWPFTTGNTLEVQVTTWVLAPATGFDFNDNAGDCNVSLTVPAADYGIHQGFVIATGVGGTIKLPYTYNVHATYDTEGAVLELANGEGTTWTPYDPGVLMAGFDAYYAPGSSDHHSLVVDMTDDTVMYFAARAEWTNADTDMDVAIVDAAGYELAHSGDAVKATDTTALAIADVDGETGLYIIHTTMNSIAGPAPEHYVLTVVGYDALNEPVLTLSWYSRDSPTQQTFTAGDTIAGDHVIVNATWTDGVNPGMPEFAITSTEIKVLYGTLFYAEGHMVHATDPGGVFDGIIDPDQFAWETVPGLNAGDTARIICDFDTSDADIMMWPPSIPMEERTYANNIVDMASGDHPETDTIVLPESGDYAVGILDYSGDGGDYYLTIDTRLGLEPARVFTNTIELDTYYLLANQTYGILVDSDTGTNLRYSIEAAGVTIGNFFAPEVTVPAPTPLVSDPNTFDITWSSTDLNADDTTYYSLWLSNNDGVSYMLLAQNLTTTTFQWNSSGWLEGSYMIRVRAYSLDFTVGDPAPDVGDPPAGYWPGDFGDGFSPAFDAGDVPLPTSEPEPTTSEPEPTTSEPEPTTTDEPTPGPILDPLLIGLVGGIGVGVVIILILFLIRKK
jgi:hypothetical protein